MSVKKCKFKSEKQKKEKLGHFLNEHGDDLPEDVIEDALNEGDSFENFEALCDDGGEGEVVSVATYEGEDNDWYLCSIEHLATAPNYRGKGYGTKVVQEVLEETKRDNECLILNADITRGNVGSEKIFENFGFEDVNSFMWGATNRPANVYQLVKFPPKQQELEMNKDLISV